MNKILPIILIIDHSGSMYGDKIDTINIAIKNMINSFKTINHLDIKLSVIIFSTLAEVHIEFKNISEVVWENIEANGASNFGKAISLLKELINNIPLENSCYPEIILISDGTPTDFDWEDEAEDLLKLKVTEGANFNGMFIGDDDGLNFLKKFLNKVNRIRKNKVFHAYNTMYIKDFFNNLEIKLKKKEI